MAPRQRRHRRQGVSPRVVEAPIPVEAPAALVDERVPAPPRSTPAPPAAVPRNRARFQSASGIASRARRNSASSSGASRPWTASEPSSSQNALRYVSSWISRAPPPS
jgi:hypothetical protein